MIGSHANAEQTRRPKPLAPNAWQTTIDIASEISIHKLGYHDETDKDLLQKGHKKDSV
jgi:hypothetical protein